jgi:transposase-like protein
MQRRRFTAAFKRKAVRLAQQPGRSRAKVAQELGLNANTLGQWVLQFGSGEWKATHGKPLKSEQQPRCAYGISARDRQLRDPRRDDAPTPDPNLGSLYPFPCCHAHDPSAHLMFDERLSRSAKSCSTQLTP